MILAGDVGGTHSRLALFDDGLRLLEERTYPSARHAGLGELIAAFLAATGASVERACFGVAGPVRDGRSKITNLPWRVDAGELARQLNLPRVALLNDLEATAHGIPALTPGDTEVLHEGDPHRGGNAALIAAGTGLGEAALFWDGQEHLPFANEGGHASFAPRDTREIALLQHLLDQHPTVSWERVVSGPGLHHIYLFLRAAGGEEPEWLAREMRQGDPAAVIGRAALAGGSPLCTETVELFVSLFGAEAGNLALKVMATGGVYVGGGMTLKLLTKIKEGGFLESFFGKGRMRPLLEAMPVRLILDEAVTLKGAARFAARADHVGRRAKTV